MTKKNVREGQHDSVYGSSFALYDRKSLREFLEPFRIRFQANGLDPVSFFKGRRCLDAGCGNGRGSLFMLENGAAHVTAVDISDQNIRSTARNLTDYDFSNFTCQRTSLEALPFDAAAFDFVWCNGVVMHTANPDGCISDLARVLKPSGAMWLYVYGTGGVYWHFVRQFRSILAHVSVDQLIASLQLLNYSVRFIGEYVDDWKTPYLRAYHEKTVRKKLEELGFVDIRRMMKGMPYDTCARIEAHPGENELLGDGDLRYIAVRDTTTQKGGETLNCNSIDDPIDPASTTARLFGTDLEQLAKLVRRKDLIAIAACARLQHFLRENVMSTSERIDIESMSRRLKETLKILRSLE